jgi:hypothetical protein
VQPKSKLLTPCDAGYTAHREMEERRKETQKWLREREQQVRDRMNAPSMVLQSEAIVVTEPEKNHIH